MTTYAKKIGLSVFINGRAGEQRLIWNSTPILEDPVPVFSGWNGKRSGWNGLNPSATSWGSSIGQINFFQATSDIAWQQFDNNGWENCLQGHR
jgi:hypothetical protein